MNETLEQKVEAGKRAAAERFAALDPATQQRVLSAVAGIPERLTRTFCSPDNGKGRQSSYVATPEEFAQWKSENIFSAIA